MQKIGGLDFHVLATLLFRSWAIIAGAVTIYLLPFWLSPTEQGYYFTFASVLALQIFFELGLNQIVMQLVSHEMAQLTETTDGLLVGKETHLNRLSSLARMIVRWYSVAALMFALMGGIAGVLFFAQKGTEPMSVWLGVWVLIVCATAINLWLSPGMAVMEGCGKVGQVARLRLVQSFIGYAILWMSLLCGAGLWAAAAVPIVSVVCTGYWLKSHGNMLRWLSTRATDLKETMSWRVDVLPLQWRIALSWASGYLIFNLFTPMVFSRHGAVEAGRLGMALTVFSAISTIGMSWVNAKAPNFTTHIACGERRELNILFRAVFLRSTIAIALTSVCVLSIVWYLNKIGSLLVMRIASLDVLVVLAIVTIVNSIIFSMAIYMRAHREEPMLTQSIVVGLIIALMIYWTSRDSIFTMMFFYMLIVIFIALPWTIWLYYRYQKKIH